MEDKLQKNQQIEKFWLVNIYYQNYITDISIYIIYIYMHNIEIYYTYYLSSNRKWFQKSMDLRKLRKIYLKNDTIDYSKWRPNKLSNFDVFLAIYAKYPRQCFYFPGLQ